MSALPERRDILGILLVPRDAAPMLVHEREIDGLPLRTRRRRHLLHGGPRRIGNPSQRWIARLHDTRGHGGSSRRLEDLPRPGFLGHGRLGGYDAPTLPSRQSHRASSG
jgi:hypothetical protein